jgi:hypothetical protein
MSAHPKLLARIFSLVSNHFAASSMHIGFKLGLVLVTSSLVTSLNAQIYVPNRLDAEFAVSPSGAATYRVPLPLPPGINDHEPKLSLNYNSQGGNGMVGMGWSLAGLSSITRCAQTRAQDGDGFVSNITNTWTDRFCLDGQRLVRVEPSTGASINTGATGPYYVVDNTEYRTELETYSRVQAFGQYGNGPAYFVVQTKFGQKMWFGNTADSVTLAADGTTRTRWAVTRIDDTDGNSINLDYKPDYQNGVIYPNTVRYGGTEVAFSYEARPDVPLFYRAGQLEKTTLRLLTISIKPQSLGSITTTARLTYQNNGDTNRSLMSQLQFCDSANQCMTPLQFDWSPKLSTQLSSKLHPGNLNIPNNQIVYSYDSKIGHIVDINGDGRADVVQANLYLNLKNVFLSTPSGLVRSDSYTNSLVNSDIWFEDYLQSDIGSVFVDVNGDGLVDVVRLYLKYNSHGGPTVRAVYLNTGSSLVYDTAYSQSLPDAYITSNRLGTGNDVGARIVDINGDGLADLIQLYQPGGGPLYNNIAQKRIFLNNGSQFVYNAVYSASLPNIFFGVDVHDGGVRLADVNGDGRIDLMQSANYDGGGVSTNLVYLNNGTGFYYDPDYSGSLSGVPFVHFTKSSNSGIQIQDLNNDGLVDLIQLYRNVLYGYPSQDYFSDNVNPVKRVLLNTGKKFIYDAGYSNSLGNTFFTDIRKGADLGGTRLADMNGDGYPDIIQISETCVFDSAVCPPYALYINTGEKFVLDVARTENLRLNFEGYCCQLKLDLKGLELGDVDGDGSADFIAKEFYSRPKSGTDLVVRIGYPSNPSATLSGSSQDLYSIWYNHLSEATPIVSNFYTKSPESAYPRISLQTSLQAVSLVSKHASPLRSDRGGSNQRTDTEYRYEGLKAELGSGRGILGFSKVVAKSDTNYQPVKDLETTNYYSQDWPTLGMQLRSEIKHTGRASLLKRVTNNLQCLRPHDASSCAVAAGNRYFPYVQSTTEERWDLNGAALPTSTTGVEYWRNPADAQFWGDPNKTTTTLSDGSSKVSENTYQPAVITGGRWVLGRLIRSKVTSKQSLANTGSGVIPGGVMAQSAAAAAGR